MPNRKKTRGRRRGPRASSGYGTTKIRGHFVAVLSSAITDAFVALNPLALDQRLIEISDEFQEFRFTKVQVALVSNVNYNSSAAQANTVSVSYSPVVLTNAPLTVLSASSLENFRRGSGQPGDPWPTLRVGRRELTANGPKWFRRGTAFDDLLETQGMFYFTSTVTAASQAWSITFRYEIELKAAAQASLTVPRVAVSGAMDDIALVNNMVAKQQGHALWSQQPQRNGGVEEVKTAGDATPGEARPLPELPAGYVLVKRAV